jgi:hypothetical protein
MMKHNVEDEDNGVWSMEDKEHDVVLGVRQAGGGDNYDCAWRLV